MIECSLCGQRFSETYFLIHMTEHIIERQETDRG